MHASLLPDDTVHAKVGCSLIGIGAILHQQCCINKRVALPSDANMRPLRKAAILVVLQR